MTLYVLRLDPRNRFFKIGQTQNLEQRLRIYKRDRPRARLVHVVPDAGLREKRALRRLLAPCRSTYLGSQRDVFELNEAQEAFVLSLQSPQDFEEALAWIDF